jgi:FlaA1/EpsC-like NDP-sugar epimerase
MKLLQQIWTSRPFARRVLIVFSHIFLWALAFLAAFALRFDGLTPLGHDRRFLAELPKALLTLAACRLLAFWVFRQFHGMWRYAGIPELKGIVAATTAGTLVFSLIGLMSADSRMPRSVYLIEWIVSMALVGGLRFALRVFREAQSGQVQLNAVRTLLIGAGDAADSLLRDIQRSKSPWSVVACLDDDPRKNGVTIRGIPIIGAADEPALKRAVAMLDVKLVLIAMPNATGARIREIVDVCRAAGVPTKTIPGLPDRIGGDFRAAHLRNVAIGDLLRRDPVKLDVAKVEGFLCNKTLLITGAGGSIGSELARQVLRFGPKKVLLLDHDENALFDIERELRASHPEAALEPLMGDVTEPERIREVFRRFRPEVVLHAAAHKHVTMMEANPCEAVKNNIFGTRTVAVLAAEYRAEAFVLISTDKAVNPTSVMGATKRVAEMVIQQIAATSATRFAAVRFGNVLGSAGSVVPIFQEQIARGGPIYVTHPDVCRYFMTIPEASQLVLQAGAQAGRGEIFVLDMGQPVKIVNLAHDLITLSGLKPEVDIQIEFTGLRPGEKLFEELLLAGEAFDRTPHPKILVGRIKPTAHEILAPALVQIERDAIAGEELAVRQLLSLMVPEGSLVPSIPSNASGASSANVKRAGHLRDEPSAASVVTRAALTA